MLITLLMNVIKQINPKYTSIRCAYNEMYVYIICAHENKTQIRMDKLCIIMLMHSLFQHWSTKVSQIFGGIWIRIFRLFGYLV